MIDIQITINLSTDPNQFATFMRGLQTLTDQIDVNGAKWPQNANSGTDTPAGTQNPQLDATTPAKTKTKRGRKPKIVQEVIDHKAYWDQFHALVCDEMRRLSVNDRMPTKAIWNNERDPRLPTIAKVLRAYTAENMLQLASFLEMRPPVEEIGVDPFSGVAQ